MSDEIADAVAHLLELLGKKESKDVEGVISIAEAIHEPSLEVAVAIAQHGGYQAALDDGCLGDIAHANDKADEEYGEFPLEEEDVPWFTAYETAILGSLWITRKGFRNKGIDVPPAVYPQHHTKETT